MKQMSTLQLGKNIYEINDATARKLITELSKNLDNVKVVDGKSAYEIAVENGFVGSEADWLASLKGEKGDTGNGISTITKKSTTNNIDTYTITFTNGNTIDYNVTNGVDGVGISDISYKETDSNGNYIYTITLTDDGSYDIIVPKGDIGIQGIQGEVGETPNISMTAEVDNTVGTPSVTVTKSGTNESPSFNLAFSNLKGETGSQGEQGVQGTQGLSAYEVAVQNGYSGTESEWLESLKGEEYDDKPIWKVQGEFGCKNLLSYPYYQSEYSSSGLTFTTNDDGSVVLNGTINGYASMTIYNSNSVLPQGKYALSIDSSSWENKARPQLEVRLYNGTTLVSTLAHVDYSTQSQEFEITQEIVDTFANTDTYLMQVRLFAQGGTYDNTIIYPMIRYASDTDDTWQPYILSNKKLESELNNIHTTQNRVGAKNLLSYPYNNNGAESIGVTYTVNDDGSILASGTATSYSYVDLKGNQNYNPWFLKAGKYILSDGVSGSTNARLVIRLKKGSNIIKTFATTNGNGKGIEFEVTDEDFALLEDGYSFNVRIYVNSGTIDDVIYPMIRYASDTDDTWQPYAMSNKQLTDAIMSNGEEIANESTVSQELKPNYFHLFTNAVESLTITLPSNRRPWNEFNFAFTTSSSGCNLALPSAVTWIGDTPTLDANTYYEVSIKNDKAVLG